MDFKSNIIYREKLLNKARVKEKISKEERFWLISSPTYNSQYDTPVFMRDVIDINPRQVYKVTIRMLSTNFHGKVFSVIGVAAGNGYIETDYKIYDLNGKEAKKNRTKALVSELNSEKMEVSFNFYSELGKMEISYACEYFDDFQQVIKMEMANHLGYAMKKSVLSEYELQYVCKNPCIETDEFDALVYTVEIKAVHKKGESS